MQLIRLIQTTKQSQIKQVSPPSKGINKKSAEKQKYRNISNTFNPLLDWWSHWTFHNLLNSDYLCMNRFPSLPQVCLSFNLLVTSSFLSTSLGTWEKMWINLESFGECWRISIVHDSRVHKFYHQLLGRVEQHLWFLWGPLPWVSDSMSQCWCPSS